MLLKESTHQKNFTLLNVYAANNRASKYMKQKLIKLEGEIEKSTIIVEIVNIPLSIIEGKVGRKSPSV